MRGNLTLFDVDGTIITEDNYIPISAVNAIRAAQQAGNLCFVNTGRPYSHIVPSVKEIGFSGYMGSGFPAYLFSNLVTAACWISMARSMFRFLTFAT